MKKIAVLVSGNGTNLQSLIDAKADRQIPEGELALVVSSRPDAYALERARRANIPTTVLRPTEYQNRDDYSDALLKTVQAYGVELVVMAGFMHILSAGFCEAFPNAIINIHPSLIPSFCGQGYYGLRVHKAALEYGVKFTGATVHFVTAEPDAGPIINQRWVAVYPDDTPESLQKRVIEEAEHVLLPEAIAAFCEGRLRVHGRSVRTIPVYRA